MRVLAIITARKGSKGLSCKNFRTIAGKSITEISIDCAIEAKKKGYIDDIYVSTDSQYLLDIANVKLGKNIKIRKKELCGDNVKSIDVVNDVLSEIKEDFTDIIILQPTSPLRTADDIGRAIEIYKSSNPTSLVSVVRLENINPNGLYYIDDNIAQPLLDTHASGVPRQSNRTLYLRNGAIFISNINMIKNENTLISSTPACYIMPKERSVNIDTLTDFEEAVNFYPNKGDKIAYHIDSDSSKIYQNTENNHYINLNLYLQLYMYLAEKFECTVYENIELINDEIHKFYYFDGRTIFFMGDDITDKVRDYTTCDEIFYCVCDYIKNDIVKLCSAVNNLIVVPNNKWILK